MVCKACHLLNFACLSSYPLKHTCPVPLPWPMLWPGICHCSIIHHDFSHLQTSVYVTSLSAWEHTTDPWKFSSNVTSSRKPSLIISSLAPLIQLISSFFSSIALYKISETPLLTCHCICLYNHLPAALGTTILIALCSLKANGQYTMVGKANACIC